MTSPNLSHSPTGHRTLAVRREQTIALQVSTPVRLMGPATARTPEKNTGNFYILSQLSYPILKGRDMWNSVISKLEVQNKNGGMNMEKITISGLKNHVMGNNIELTGLL